jgi:hypothetical protein
MVWVTITGVVAVPTTLVGVSGKMPLQSWNVTFVGSPFGFTEILSVTLVFATLTISIGNMIGCEDVESVLKETQAPFFSPRLLAAIVAYL